MSDTILKQIDDVVKGNDLVLFMKGTPQMPQCGFSQQISAILSEYGVPYAAVNVLLDAAVRQGIKDYADWPTIPQVYVKGEFVGGCDIVCEMHENGELKTILKPLQTNGEAV
ncbi:MAG: Grx4 family monothiol glutaredoxin [Zetaproteobacteria bacterium]|nr:Grx4 family monothiol glutaredoxin [Zetaproteobacteria bacterium]MDQ6952154.1 Grx4 family monothiol glutaredoxin [Mariprofundaceae bacterium]